MTSTSFNVGLTDNTRLSSRVLRPPGGGHTDIFGGEPEPPHTGKRSAAACTGVASSVGQENPKPANGATSPVTNQSPQNGQTTPTEPAAAPIPGPEPAAAPIPGPEPKESATKPEPPVAQPAKVEPPKRVRVPPGGFSSGLW